MSALFALLLLVSASPDKPLEVKFQILPPGVSGQISSVGLVRYYLLGDFLKLAEFDAELYGLRFEAANRRGIIDELKKGLVAKDAIINSLQSDKDFLAARSTRLNKDLGDCRLALQKCSSPSIWPYVVAIVGGSALILAGGFFWGAHAS